MAGRCCNRGWRGRGATAASGAVPAATGPTGASLCSKSGTCLLTPRGQSTFAASGCRSSGTNSARGRTAAAAAACTCAGRRLTPRLRAAGQAPPDFGAAWRVHGGPSLTNAELLNFGSDRGHFGASAGAAGPPHGRPKQTDSCGFGSNSDCSSKGPGDTHARAGPGRCLTATRGQSVAKKATFLIAPLRALNLSSQLHYYYNVLKPRSASICVAHLPRSQRGPKTLKSPSSLRVQRAKEAAARAVTF